MALRGAAAPAVMNLLGIVSPVTRRIREDVLGPAEGVREGPDYVPGSEACFAELGRTWPRRSPRSFPRPALY